MGLRAASHALLLFPSRPLAPGGRYGLVVTRRVRVSAARSFEPSPFFAKALAPAAGGRGSVAHARARARKRRARRRRERGRAADPSRGRGARGAHQRALDPRDSERPARDPRGDLRGAAAGGFRSERDTRERRGDRRGKRSGGDRHGDVAGAGLPRRGRQPRARPGERAPAAHAHASDRLRARAAPRRAAGAGAGDPLPARQPGQRRRRGGGAGAPLARGGGLRRDRLHRRREPRGQPAGSGSRGARPAPGDRSAAEPALAPARARLLGRDERRAARLPARDPRARAHAALRVAEARRRRRRASSSASTPRSRSRSRAFPRAPA